VMGVTFAREHFCRCIQVTAIVGEQLSRRHFLDQLVPPSLVAQMCPFLVMIRPSR